MAFGAKKDEEKEEQLKILATNIEILNQRLSSFKPNEINLFKTEKFIDAQHKFILDTLKGEADKIVKEISKDRVSERLANLEKILIEEIKKDTVVVAEINRTVPELLALLKATISVLKEQNILLRKSFGG